MGEPRILALEALGFSLFAVASFGAAMWALHRQE
jgi:hypothetical protein